MPVSRQLPRGLNKDYKDNLVPLVEDGWNISRTRKGHLKLTHPEASQVVTGASTPSDFRSVLNLKAQCRSALRGGSTLSSPQETLSEQACRETLRLHKKARKTKARRPNTGVVHRPDRKTPVTANRLNHEASDMKTEKPAHFKTATPATAPKPAKKATEASAPPPRKDVSIAQPAQPAAASVPDRSTDMRRIPAEVFDLAMGIASSDIPAIEVTAEMVGARVAVKDGVMYLIEAGGIAPMASPVSDVPQKSPNVKTRCRTEERARAVELRDTILKLLAQYEDPMTLSEIVTLLPDHMKTGNASATTTRVTRQCSALMVNNKITRDKSNGKCWTYRLTGI